MQDSFDAVAYVHYLRHRWRFIATACATAVTVTLLLSLLLSKRYTATSSILIEAPAGNDVRTATAVSPVYLESLKSYEYFAGGDSLFRKAVDHFHLRANEDSGSIESLKRRVLRVNKVRDTRILEISATLPDPKLAQALVQFLAEQTVALNQGLAQAGDHDLGDEAQRLQAETKSQLDKLQTESAQLEIKEPVMTLKGEIDDLLTLKARVRQDLLQAQVDAAEEQGDPQSRRGSGARLRALALARQAESLEREQRQKAALLAERSKGRELLSSQIRAAEAAYESATAHLREIRSASGFRGERLRIVDPGIVPERPSSPNVPLNAVIALALALTGSILYLTVKMQFEESSSRETARGAAR